MDHEPRLTVVHATWLALLTLFGACSPASSPTAATPIGGAPLSSGSATPTATAPAVHETSPCEPQLHNDESGHHDRFVFEKRGGWYGYKNGKGQVVIGARFRFAYEFSPEGIAAVMEDAGPLFIDATGKPLARAYFFDNGPDYFADGKARIVKQDKVGFIDVHGKIVIEPRYDFASPFCRDRAIVCMGCRRETLVSGGQWGLIDGEGNEVAPLRYDRITGSDGNTFVAERGAEKVTIDRDGKPRD